LCVEARGRVHSSLFKGGRGGKAQARVTNGMDCRCFLEAGLHIMMMMTVMVTMMMDGDDDGDGDDDDGGDDDDDDDDGDDHDDGDDDDDDVLPKWPAHSPDNNPQEVWPGVETRLCEVSYLCLEKTWNSPILCLPFFAYFSGYPSCTYFSLYASF
jgi:hypothetical protein